MKWSGSSLSCCWRALTQNRGWGPAVYQCYLLQEKQQLLFLLFLSTSTAVAYCSQFTPWTVSKGFNAKYLSDCDHVLLSGVSAHLAPPLDPTVPSILEAVEEDVYIQQLQALTNRYEQQSAAPHSAEMWALRGAGQK